MNNTKPSEKGEGGKPHIFLDLDLTLICAEELDKVKKEDKREKFKSIITKFDPNFKVDNFFSGNTKDLYDSSIKARERKIHVMDDDYIIFVRPGLQEFLDFLFKNFRVSVWTAASKDYALFIIQYILLLLDENENKLEADVDRDINYIFFYYHCIVSEKKDGGYKNLKFLCSKDPTCTEDRMFILDDNPSVYSTQPKSCIQADEFEPIRNYKKTDDFLLTTAKPKLESQLVNLGLQVVN